jgi:glycosyltransferase involved in cell wall biosynthesis
MNVAYVTAYDPEDVAKVNGAGQYIAACLRAQDIDLQLINLKYAPSTLLLRVALKLRAELHRRLHRTSFVPMRDRLLMYLYSLELKWRLRGSAAEIVFSPLCPGSLPTSYFSDARPSVFWSDATFAGLLDFYPGYTNLAPQTVRDGLANERAAMARCRLAIFSSEWAAQTAREQYGIAPERVAIVPFGPYTTELPTAAEVERMIAARRHAPFRLLFVGRSWERKGGDIALAALNALTARGVAAELTIVGCRPPVGQSLPANARAIGFLSKADPQQARQLRELYARSNMLLLPTRADCAPAVVREASAYGLPCLTSDVGGLGTVVRNGRNGWALPLSADATAYAEIVAELCAAPARYQALARSSFEEYRERLNWDSAGRAVRRLLDGLVATPPAPAPVSAPIVG